MLSSSLQGLEADLAPVFAALGDDTRLSLLTELSSAELLSISQLASNSDLTRQAITKHLRVLETAGLVRSNKVGRESLFALRPDRLADACSFLDAVSEKWDDALARLRSHVE